MFIEYDLRLKGEVCERGIMNAEHIKWVQIEQHGGGYGKCIEVYYSGHDSKGIFIMDNDEIINQVFDALKKALFGRGGEIPGVGYIRAISRLPYWGADQLCNPVIYGD